LNSANNTTSSAAPTGILPKDDFQTVHAASTLKLQNGDRIWAGIISCEQLARQSTDQAVIEWMPEAPVKKLEVLKNGKSPRSLGIQLYNLTTTGNQQT
jgi:hypothetical protein